MENIGLYVHIPFCKAKCAYCNFNSSPNFAHRAQYLAALGAEAGLRARSGRLRADSVFFGGGTPSVLTAAEFSRAAEGIFRHIPLAKDCEFTVECNPESVTEEKLAAYRQAGVNRVSLGIQSLDDAVLRRAGRLHTAAQAERALELIAKRFERVSADFILGLPGQGEADVSAMCRLAERYRLSHVSAYGLKVEPGTPFAAQAERGELPLPDEDRTADLYDALRARLAELGLERYEVSNFAQKGCECRHNLKYWTQLPYLGLGVSAHSYLENERFYNPDGMEEYLSALSAGRLPEAGRERVEGENARFEYVMLRLRTRWGVDRAQFLARFGTDFLEQYGEVIGRFLDFFSVSAERVAVSENGFYVLNSLLTEFL